MDTVIKVTQMFEISYYKTIHAYTRILNYLFQNRKKVGFLWYFVFEGEL